MIDFSIVENSVQPLETQEDLGETLLTQSLGNFSKNLLNAEVRKVFGNESTVPALADKEDEEALREVLQEDYNRSQQSGDLEGLQKSIEVGAVKDPNVARQFLQDSQKEDVTPQVVLEKGVAEITSVYSDDKDMNTKSLVLQNMAADAWDKSSAGDIVAETAKGLIPGVSTWIQRANSLTKGSLRWPSTVEMDNADFLRGLVMRSDVSPQEFYEFLSKTREAIGNDIQFMDLLSSVTDRNYNSRNLDVLDLAVPVSVGAKGISSGAKGISTATKITKGLAGATVQAIKEIPGASTAVNVVAHPVKLSKLAGDRDALIAAIKLAKDSGDKEALKLIADETLPTLLSTRGTLEDVQQAGNTLATQEMKDSARLNKRTEEVIRVFESEGGKIEEIEQKAFDKLLEDSLEAYKEANPDLSVPFADIVAMRSVPDSDGSYQFLYTIGRPSGITSKGAYAEPFKTRKQAEKFLETSGLSDGKVVQDQAGWWVSAKVDSKGTLSEAWESVVGTGKSNEFKGGPLSKFKAYSNRPYIVRVLNNLAVYEKEGLVLPEFRQIINNYKSLSKADKDALDFIIEAGQRGFDDPLWFKQSWLKEHGASDAVIKAYEDYRVINDVEHYFKNKATLKELERTGGQAVYFNDSYRGVQFEVDTSKGVDADAFYFRINGSDEPVELSQEAVNEYIKQGYRFTKAPESFGEIPANRIRNIWDPKGYSAQAPAGDFVVSYVPGGRAYYSSNNTFIKQLNIGSGLKNEASKYVTGINTLFAGADGVRAKKIAEMLEAARKVWIDRKALGSAADAKLFEVTQGQLPFAYSMDDFDKWAKSVGLSQEPAAVIEAVKDGESLASYNMLMSKGVKDLDPEDTIKNFKRSSSSLYTDERKLKKKQRTFEDIAQFDKDFVPLRMDIKEQLGRQLNDITNLMTMNDYAKYLAESFERHFRKSGVMDENLTAAQTLQRGVLAARTESNKEAWDAAKAAIENYQTLRNIPNAFDKKVTEATQSLLRMAKLPEKVVKGADAKNLRALRAVAVLNTFFLNTRQLATQMAGIVNTHLLNLTDSLKADAMLMISPAFRSGNKKSIVTALKAAGLEFENLDELQTLYDNAVYLMGKGMYSEGGLFEGSLDFSRGVLKTGMAPYRMGEWSNRFHAAITTLLEKGGDFKTNRYRKIKLANEPAEVIGDIRLRNQQFYMNMDAAAKAPLQTSQVYQTAFQFLTYKCRFLELAFDSEISWKRRAAFYLGNTILWGSVGMGFGNVFEDTATPLQDSEAVKALNMGVVNYFLDRFVDGSYVPDVGEVVSPTVFDTFTYLQELVTEGFRAPAALSVHKSFRAVPRMLKGLSDMVFGDYTKEEYMQELYSFLKTSESPMSGLARTIRAVEVFEKGALYDSKGMLSAEDLSTVHRVLHLLGFNNLKDSQFWEAKRVMAGRRQDLNKAASELQPYFNSWMNDVENPEKQAVFIRRLHAIGEGLDDESKGKLWSTVSGWSKDNHTDAHERLWRYLAEQFSGDYADKVMKDYKEEGEL